MAFRLVIIINRESQIVRRIKYILMESIEPLSLTISSKDGPLNLKLIKRLITIARESSDFISQKEKIMMINTR